MSDKTAKFFYKKGYRQGFFKMVHPGVSVCRALIFVLILLFYYEVEYGSLSLPFHFNFLA